jgi:hypothetical protein
MFYLLLSTILLQTHCSNYMANRTTNERFGRRKLADDTDASASNVSSLSDLSTEKLDEERGTKGNKRGKRRGCLANCCKMMTNTKVTP